MSHDSLNPTYLNQVEDLKEIVAYYVPKECFNVNELKKIENKYEILRRSLVQNASIRKRLPEFIVSCRTLREAGNYIRKLVEEQEDDYLQISTYITTEFQSILNWLEFGSDPIEKIHSSDKFKAQFPAGLPFGLQKPDLGVIPLNESQRIDFKDELIIGVIRENVYPNFTYTSLEKSLSGTPIGSSDLKKTLLNMCQTNEEIDFLNSYGFKYQMRTEKVPVLIPQAWIRWHSKTKEELRKLNSSCVNEPCRVDFVAFWGNQRFVIFIDDIGHYAKWSNNKYWNADEEKYSISLKENRKLEKEGWKVFRVSNWEIRNESQRTEILEDLKALIGF